MKARNFTLWNYLASALFIIATLLFYLLFIVPVESRLDDENRALTYWRAMHLSSGVSPLVPIVSILIGLYLTFWLALHGLALFGPDRPRLPSQARLRMKDLAGKTQDFLRMFSAEDAAVSVECAAMPLVWKAALTGCILFTIFLVIPFLIVQGVPVRSLGARTYSIIFLIGLTICCTLSIVQAWRLTETWKELKRLLNYLDRLPLRRTLAALHGFSWGSVWTMSGNVLEVRYKVISRQMECMNHTIASLQSVNKYAATTETNRSLAALARMRRAGTEFAKWYSKNYREPLAGNLKSFRAFQKIVAAASGALLTQLLLPAWREEEESLIAAPKPSGEDKEGAAATKTLLARDPHVRNAEEFVCLNYLAFVQNVLGRMRTMAVTIVVLFLAATIAVSTYPFDPRPALSAVLITLFVVTGVVIVKVYADMHRDATLSHVTNTKPGELGVEFWFKVVGFGLAPLIGLMTRLFPSVTDFIFSWLQPGMASLK